MKIIVETQGRVDKILADALPQYSRAALHKLFGLDLITLDGVVVKPGQKVRIGTTIEADLSPLEQEPEVVELPILYEDEDVLVIDKPAGIISHARGKYWYEPSVASFLRFHLYGNLNATDTESTAQNQYERAGIVHRLDRATSGIMICAKNDATTKFLQKQFADRKVTKTYIALVKGSLPDTEAIIDAPIDRNMKKPTTFQVAPKGKPAQTHYVVLDTQTRLIDGSKIASSKVELQPKTGRTHQLRVHLKYVKHPIIGDELYGIPADRLYLHAHKLSIMLPKAGLTEFVSPLPESFEHVV